MLKNTMVGSLVVAAALTAVGCAKSATVRPDARNDAADSTKAADTAPAAKKADTSPAKATEGVADKKETPAADKVTESTVYFDYDSDNLSSAARDQLAAFVELVKKTGVKASFVLEGHADERGTEEYNLALGDRRANAVRRYLEKLGISGKQMRVVSYGENKPAVQGTGESAWSRNRRVEIVPPQMTSSLQ